MSESEWIPRLMQEKVFLERKCIALEMANDKLADEIAELKHVMAESLDNYRAMLHDSEAQVAELQTTLSRYETTAENCDVYREQAKAAPAEVPYALRQWAMDDEPESTLFDEGYNAARRWVKMQLEKPAEPEGDAVKVPRDLLCRWECELDQIPNAFHISDEMAALLGGDGCD